jgi:DNA repair protein RecN (Recombination protein N)
VKHAVEPDGLAALLGAREKELAAIEGASGSEATLRADAARLEKEARALGEELSAARRKAAQRLGREVALELAELGMPGASLAIEVAPDPQGASSFGHDRVEILIRANAGDEPKPLRKIASGGEAARVMLALKSKIAGEGSVPTLVFDEVDASIGGRLGTTIGEKLRALAARWQVLCVTHLPQIASFADHHLHVRKAVVGEQTVSTVSELDAEQRLREIAAMIRGEAVTDVSLAEAREMIEAARALPASAPAPAPAEAASAATGAAPRPAKAKKAKV